MAHEGDWADDGVVWLSAADGELQAVRVDSRTTQGAYAVIESVVEPDASAPTHLHRNEEEHLLVIYLVKDTRPDEIPALASQFGCDILGPPAV